MSRRDKTRTLRNHVCCVRVVEERYECNQLGLALARNRVTRIMPGKSEQRGNAQL
jgi:hypothetical protein